MDDKNKNTLEEDAVVVDSDSVEVAYDDYPKAEESDGAIDLGITGEPEPFDPYDEIKEPESKPEPEPAQELDDAPPQKKSHLHLFIFALCFIAIALSIFLVVYFVFINTQKPGSSSSTTVTVIEDDTGDPYNKIKGVWESQMAGGTCYIFTPDKTFYWLRNCEDFEDNYYYGDIQVKQGDEALADLGISLARALELVSLESDEITSKNIYSLHLKPSEFIYEAEDKTASSKEIQLLFVYDSNYGSYGYQYNSGDRYTFARRNDVKVPTRKKCGQTYYDFDSEQKSNCDYSSSDQSEWVCYTKVNKVRGEVMSPSYLKDLLLGGREIEFDFGTKRYVLKRVIYRSTTEFAFGQKWGEKITSSYFDDLYYRRIDGYSLSEMMNSVSGNQIYIY